MGKVIIARESRIKNIIFMQGLLYMDLKNKLYKVKP
jgi:hypothetical protein